MAPQTTKTPDIDAATMAMIEAAANAAWPVRDIVLVVVMARMGASAYDIATSMSPMRSRNSVAGKINRLSEAGVATGRRRVGRPRKNVSRETAAETEAQSRRHMPGPKTLQQLQQACCRWPMGDTSPDDPAFRFCGEHKLDGLPYCSEHAKVAYVPPQLPVRVVEANAHMRILIEG